MCQSVHCLILFCLLADSLCHVDKSHIKRSNDAIKIFFIICVLLIVIGFIIGTVLLTIALPFIVDPAVAVDDDGSTSSSDEDETDEQTSAGDSDESLLLTDDEQESTKDHDMDEIASF